MKITIRSLLVMMTVLLAACQAPLQPSPSAYPPKKTANDGSL